MKKKPYNKRYSTNEKHSKNNTNIFFYQSIMVIIIAIGLYYLDHFNENYANQIFQVINNTIQTNSEIVVMNENFQIEDSILEQIERIEREREVWGEEN